MSDVAIVLLAAGNSTRMGTLKQLLDFRGKPLLRHSADVALAAGLGKVIIVLGAFAELTQSTLDGLPVEIVVNPNWADGMGTSIRAGIARAAELGVEGAILALADQPFVGAEFFRTAVEQHHRTGKRIVSAKYADTVGVPVFFAASVFPLLLNLKPHHGCKGVILGHPEDSVLLDLPEAATDIDTPADYAAATQAAATTSVTA